jgi:hypothetical protein
VQALLGLAAASSCLSGDFLDKKTNDGDALDGDDDGEEAGEFEFGHHLSGGGASRPADSSAAAADAEAAAAAAAASTAASVAPEAAVGRALPFGKPSKGAAAAKAKQASPPAAARSTAAGAGQKALAPPAVGFKLFLPKYIKK